MFKRITNSWQIAEFERAPVLTRILLAAIVLVLIGAAFWPGHSIAQDAAGEFQPMERTQSRYQQRIDADPSLDDAQRARMHERLMQCLELGLPEAQLDALYPESQSRFSAQVRLRMQGQVIELAGAGMPTDLVCEKLSEGEMKRAPASAVERAVQRMSQYTRGAHDFMASARRGGVAGLENPALEQRLERGVCLDLWRGIQEDELNQLQSHARVRLQKGSCSLIELAAAAETTTELKEMGSQSDNAVRFCGDALERGYTGREIRQMGRMVMAAHMHGASTDEMLEDMMLRIREHQGMGEMMTHMMQEGWMGPESMGHGMGGNSPVDDVMWGGRHDDGMGHGDDMGGDGGHGGHDGNHGGGMGAIDR